MTGEMAAAEAVDGEEFRAEIQCNIIAERGLGQPRGYILCGREAGELNYAAATVPASSSLCLIRP